MSITRVGLAETKGYAEGWETVFGSKKASGPGKSSKSTTRTAKPAKSPARTSKPAKPAKPAKKKPATKTVKKKAPKKA